MKSEKLDRFCIMLRHTMVATSDTLDKAQCRAQQFAKANPAIVITIIDRANGDSHVVVPEY
jgi:hypothetical protein